MHKTCLPRAIGPFLLGSSRGRLLTGFLFVGMLLLLAHGAHAQSSSQSINPYAAGTTDTSALQNGMSDFVVLLFKIFKVVALLLGALGVWRLIEHDYKWGISFCVATLALFFMPTIVTTFETMGANQASSLTSGSTTGP